MKRLLVIVACSVCISGCADVRQHWADGLGKFWRHSNQQIAKHGPEVAADAAGDVASSAVDNTIDHAIWGDETPREWQERMVDEGFEE